MRDKIKIMAVELLIRDGYRGLRFGDIATALGITRANIHYHFGTKQRLVEEVVEDYLRETLTRFRGIWNDPDASFDDKIRRTTELNRERYLKFNPGGTGANPWSLIARMRVEREVLSARTRAELRDFVDQLHASITAAIEAARRDGELTQSAPVHDIAGQLVFIINSANAITQDNGSFEQLEQLYVAFTRIIAHAYGRKGRPTPVRRGVARAG